MSDGDAEEVLWCAIADEVVGTTMSPAAIAERWADVSEDDVEECLEEEGVVTCPQCGWWVLSKSTDEEGYCEDCTEDEAGG